MINNHFKAQISVPYADNITMRSQTKQAKKQITEELVSRLMSEPELFSQTFDKQNNLTLVIDCLVVTQAEFQVIIKQVHDEILAGLKAQNESVILKPDFGGKK